MIKKHLFIKSIFTLALAGTILFSNGLTTLAQHADSTFSFPFAAADWMTPGMIGFEITGIAAKPDKSEMYITSDSTFKLNCTSAEVMPSEFGTWFVTIFYPDSTLKQNGISQEALIPMDALMMDGSNNFIDGVYGQEVTYTFGETCNIVTPELIECIRQYGSGTLMMGISGTGAEFTLADDLYLKWPNISLNDFVLEDYTTSSQPNAQTSPAEIQPAAADTIPVTTDTQVPLEVPSVDIPVETNSNGLTYTAAKYDTLGVIALNYYGSYDASNQLYKVNKDILKQNGNKPVEGMQLNLPVSLGSYTLITPPQITGNEQLYSVKAGDTLHTIAQKIYGDSSSYQDLFERNKDRIKDINHIYEGQIIVCP